MEEKFFYAIQANDVTTLRRQLDNGANVNTQFTGQLCPYGRQSRWSALHLCCEKGHYECAQELLKAGADPNSYDKWNLTPLAYAVQTQWHNLVDLLLDHGADVNVQDRKGRTPVHFCVEYRDDICVWETKGLSDSAVLIDTLVRSGADPDIGDVLGRTPLWIASCEDGHVDQIRSLLAAKCDVNAQDVREKRTPLQAAIMHAKEDRLRYVRMMLGVGTDVNKRDARNHTAFMNVIWRTWADDKEHVRNEDMEICKLILKHNYDANTVRKKTTYIEYCGSALALAVERGALPLVDMLLSHGADPNITDSQNVSPLTLSAHRNKIGCTARLLYHNPDMSFVGQLKIDGNWVYVSAFQCACSHGNMDIAMLLVQAGFDLTNETYLWTNENVPPSFFDHLDFWAWLREDVSNAHTLIDICRIKIRCILGKRIHEVKKMAIPSFLKGLILLDNIVAPWIGT